MGVAGRGAASGSGAAACAGGAAAGSREANSMPKPSVPPPASTRVSTSAAAQAAAPGQWIGAFMLRRPISGIEAQHVMAGHQVMAGRQAVGLLRRGIADRRDEAQLLVEVVEGLGGAGAGDAV